ncbi:MAG: RnfABCDGE type electron transport complex subunit D [Candidatus Omnitrophota bacterium]
MEPKLIISAAPHVRDKHSVKTIMWSVILALLPSGFAGIFIFGPRALWVILTCIATAVLTEAVIEKLTRRKITISDGSALITGILLAYNLPSNIPLWAAAAGTFFAIAIVKQAFGGLGHNIFNPALAGRVFLQVAYPRIMSSWPKPFSVDAITGATALEIKKLNFTDPLPSYWDLFIGNRGGCIGEVCIIALLLGAAYLFYKKYIYWQTPVAFIGTVAIISWIFAGPSGLFKGDVLFQLLTGGLVLGAFFMATDYVTSPVTKKGMLIFGFGCGLITSIIRLWAGYPEGVSYSILMMNITVPLLDRWTKPRVFGIKRIK